MNEKTRAYLQLVRPPNLFTAAADIVAGLLFIGGGWAEVDRAILLSLCSMCLYAGGVALNDLRDAERDRVERPNRPIPSGRVSARHAAFFVGLLMIFALILAAIVSIQHVLIAGALVMAIVSYDVLAKDLWIAPMAMGACRALNLTLGMTALGNPITATEILPILAMGLYITSVTAFARTEARQSERGRLQRATVGALIAVASLAGLYTMLPEPSWTYLIPLALLAAIIGRLGTRAARTGAPRDVQRAVTMMIMLLVVFDACITAATRGILVGGIVALFLVPVVTLGRVFRAT